MSNLRLILFILNIINSIIFNGTNLKIKNLLIDKQLSYNINFS